MKTLFLSIIVLLVSAFNGARTTSASVAGYFHSTDADVLYVFQDKEITSRFKVLGNCNMCKTRIEKSIKMPEVKYTKWDKHTKMLTVIHLNSVSVDSLQNLIASSGHDTENHKAPDSVYVKLPKCCLYRDNPHTH